MTAPTIIDFGILKIGDGAGVEVFTAVCGVNAVTINQAVESQTQDVRDCATPNKVATKRITVGAINWTINGSGLSNAAQLVLMQGNIGKKRNFQLEVLANDGTDAGDLLGTYTGNALIDAFNMSITQGGDSTMEINLTGNGALTYTAAP